MMNPFSTKIFRKPEAICRYSEGAERITTPEEVTRFIASGKREIEQRVSELGFHLRLATLDDVDAIRKLHLRCFPPETTSLEDPYVLFRIMSFGYAPVIEGSDGLVLGCNICEGHDDMDRTAYGVRITVDPSAAGHNLGAELVNYACLIGMERGSGIRRGLLNPTNYGSASNFLNYVGYLGESFKPDLPGFGPRFMVALPLTPAGIISNRIDFQKLKVFMETHQQGRDFLLTGCEDLEGITRMYEKTPFRVAAFIKEGTLSEENTFFSLPKDVLGFPENDTPV
ncbi:MAG: GNAT family N-acetyltransferase [Deltaproteobacteria bacterium]|nr:GNAT family N-acetyltransferase [Deltaproteobacteria bacterium]